MKAVSLIPGTVVVLDLDGTLAYVEDVQPTHAAVVALPEQLPERRDTVVFTPGRVGPKKISPYSSAARTVEISDLSERNKDFIGTFEQLRKQHGPNYIQRTKEEEEAAAAMTVIKATAPSRSPRGQKATPEQKRDKRRARRAAKIPCVKCGKLPIHADHHTNVCEYEAPAKAEREPRTSEPKTGGTFKVIDADISKLQAENDKFAHGNRYFRVFLALKNLPDSTGTLANVIAAVALDAGKPMTNPEKVARRALKALVTAGHVQAI